MLILKKLRYQNFLSSGNKFTEIDFLSKESTLIIGDNGAGKSTINDALSYALFNKAHRNINKPSLINSINNKKCLVEVEFTVGSKNYLVRRGQKPSIFEIWKDDELVNQDSHNKEYQKFLEQNILKLNHKSFHQVVVLGSSSFVPFMQLPTGQRRQVIEDLLDISVFSRMNILLKEKQAKLRDDTVSNDYEITLSENTIESIEKNIRNIESVNEELKGKVRERLKEKKDQYKSLKKERTELEKKHKAAEQEFKKESALSKKRYSSLFKLESKMKAELSSISKSILFFEDNDDCPSCGQVMEQDLKREKIGIHESRKSQLEKTLEEMKKEIKAIEEKNTELEATEKELSEMRNKIRVVDNTMSHCTDSIAELTEKLGEVTGSKELEQAKLELEEARSKLFEKKKEKSLLEESASYYRVIAEMLKDSGIKTKIIKEYIPVINKLVNTYLEALDFYVKFELDETFKEVIKSRHRDEFTYDSFSEGEKTKIDVALLFAWRHIAQMKNSLSTNLLVLDETFDSSLDKEGIENLMQVIRTLKENTNIFVISHKAELHDRFDQTFVFKKENNFSTYDIV